MADKVIVTNDTALKRKYKAAGLTKIKAAVKTLIDADAKRGIQTTYAALDNAAAMKKLKAKPVTDAADPKENKTAIDAVFKALAPDYLMILGSIDVVPHQDLKNPVFGPDDPDRLAPGDIPYACEQPYSNDPSDFIGPTRVVGRLPDITAATDPQFLLDLLATTANYKQQSPQKYASYFGISAEVWQKSTAMSVRNTFGSDADLKTVPPETDKWPKPMVGRLAHFINCHGADTDSHFYGQRKREYPESLDASLIDGQISEGTVAAVECCYGAQLYDPKGTDGQIGISSTYLKGKAYGYLGSTTIAYGPAEGNGSADLICQFFLRRVLAGSSIGRAALEARQEFAQASPQIDPIDVKTLAQFVLLGDPSIAPVSIPTPHVATATTSKAAKGFALPLSGHDAERPERRRQLMARGLWLSESRPVAAVRRKTVTPALNRQLDAMAKENNMQDATVMSFAVKQPATLKGLPKMMMAKAPVPDTFHVIMGKSHLDKAPVPIVKALVAHESGGKIVSVKEVYGKP